MKSRVLKEWRQAKFRKAAKAKESETHFDEVELDTKHIEFEIDRTIQQAFVQTVQYMQENLGSLRLEDLRKPSKRERVVRARVEKREAQIQAEKYAQMTEEEKLQAEMDGMGLGPAGSSMAKLSNAPSSKMGTEHPGATSALGDSKKSLHDKDS